MGITSGSEDARSGVGDPELEAAIALSGEEDLDALSYDEQLARPISQECSLYSQASGR